MPRKKNSASANPPKATDAPIWFSTPFVNVERLPTKLWSFDLAIGGGIPLRTILEVSGYEHVGKSTFCSYLLGLNGGPEVAICPLESYDPQYLIAGLQQSHYKGAVWEVPPVDPKGKLRDDESMLDALVEKMMDENVKAALLDSVGAVSPVSEEEGSVREANMGRRARVMGPFMRKMERVLLRHRKTPGLMFLVNQAHPNIGVPGSNTSGGKAIHFHSATRVRLSNLEQYDDGSRSVEGKVTKLRFRPQGTPNNAVFHIVMKSGVGVHVGLTAVQDCLDAGLAEKSSGRVTLGGKAYGFHSKLIEEKWQDDDLFAPFLAALAKVTP